MKRYLLKIQLTILAIISGVSGSVQGQIPAYVPDPVVYSPQTAEMIRYDEMPVNMSTGRINLQIPLVDIQDKDFKFPITLSYNSDGFKPAEPDNFVGRNWTLNCGGIIYRQVRGIPDEITSHYTFVRVLEEGGNEYRFDGFMKLLGNGKFNMDEMRKNVTANPTKYARSADDYAPMPTIPGTNIESAPDLYHFNFGKHSGKFMINYDGSISVVGYDGHRYEVDLSDYEMTTSLYARSTKIRIKTDDGYVYTFGGTDYGPIEYSAASWEKDQSPTDYDAEHKHTINAWHLSEIKAPNGRRLSIHYKEIDENYHKNLRALLDIGILPESQWQEIASLYSLSGHAAYMTRKGQMASDPLGDLYAKKANTYLYNLNKISLVDYITVGSYKIDFHYSLKKKYTEFEYVKDGFYQFRGAQLDSISVNNEEKMLQTHSFEYSYQCANRLFLTSVKHARQGKYQFRYHIPSSSVLPTTSSIDHWGYWKGGANDSEIMPGSRYADNKVSNDFTLTTKTREPSERDCDATLLETVIFPTGGKSAFEYEPHKYSYMYVQNKQTFYQKGEQNAPGLEAVAGGARIKKIKFYDATSEKPIKETRYSYCDDTGMEGILTYMPLYRCIGLYLMNSTTLWTNTLENSDGIGHQYDPSQHILYPVVNEYYIDPKRGTDESNSPYKKTLFYTDTYSYAYTGFNYNSYTNPSFHPALYTLGRVDLETYFKNRFRWLGRNGNYKNGKVRWEYYYDDQHNYKKTIHYEYKDIERKDYSLCIYLESLLPGSLYGVYTHVNEEYFGNYLLKQKTVSEYDDQYGAIVKKEWYEYDDEGYLKKQILLLSAGDSLATNYQYLEEMPALITDKKQIIYGSGKTKAIQHEHLDYRMQEAGMTTGISWPVVSNYYTGTDSLNLEKRVQYLRYDGYGNPVEIEKDGRSALYLWGYNGQYLIAEIENATYEQVTEALDGNAPEDISNEASYSIYAGLVTELRDKLPFAHVTNYTYDPGVGMTSSTDPSGKTVFHKYDTKGRLENTHRAGETGDREILQLNEYHLVNE